MNIKVSIYIKMCICLVYIEMEYNTAQYHIWHWNETLLYLLKFKLRIRCHREVHIQSIYNQLIEYLQLWIVHITYTYELNSCTYSRCRWYVSVEGYCGGCREYFCCGIFNWRNAFGDFPNYVFGGMPWHLLPQFLPHWE